MKRIFAILLAALLLLPACDKEIRIETLKLDEDVPYREGADNHLSLNLDIDFPVSGFTAEGLEEARKAIRTEVFGPSYTDLTAPVEELGRTWRDAMVQDYKLSNEEFLKEMEMSEEDAPFLNWGYEYIGYFGDKYRHFVNYFVEAYEYNGGAHGIMTNMPVVINLKTGKKVPHGFFTGHIAPDLLKSLLDEYKLDNLKDVIDDDEIDEDEIFYVESIEPSEYYTVDENGITFYYQPYEIAPYVFGVITIPIPWKEL